ncbi:MAG: FISUMP domain-containing protein [Bacteroidales bacterium]
MSGTLLNTNNTAGHIDSYAQAVEGPFPPPVGTGYLPFSYKVTNPSQLGNYYIAFSNTNLPTFPEFDITVVTGANVPALKTDTINGRVWSQGWPFLVNSGSFSGTFYIYSDDGIVTKLSFNNAGPGTFAMFCNAIGSTNTGNLVDDRKSNNSNTYISFPEIAQYKVFLNNPDPDFCPSGSYGNFNGIPTMIPDPNFPSCSGKKMFVIDVTKSGNVEIVIQFTGNPSLADKYIVSSVLGNPPNGVNYIPWDGTDGNMVPVPDGTPLSITISYLNGLTNLPLWNINQNPQGLQVSLYRPTNPQLQIPLLYWDDSQLTPDPGNCLNPPIGANLTGCLPGSIPGISGCHPWNDVCFFKTMNTWWYSASSTTATFSLTYTATPPLPISSPQYRCDPGTISLTATVLFNEVVRWWSQPTGGTLLFTGSPYVVNLPATGDYHYYAEAYNPVSLCVSNPPRLDVLAQVSASPASPSPLGGPFFVCGAGEVTLVSNNTDPGIRIDWYDSTVPPLKVGFGNSYTTPWLTTTTTYYAEAVNIASPAGCTSTTRTPFIAMVVNPLLPVSVAVSASANNICAGTTVAFTAVPVNGGSAPSFQWKVNDIPAGNNSPVFSYFPMNNDVIVCTLTSSEMCTMGNPAISPAVIMTINPQLPVSVSITPSANPFCTGSPVTFIATPNHGGLFPVYLWKVNGSNAGANSTSFTYTPLNGDVVTCELTSSENCVTGNPATSAPTTMTASPILAVTVSITASSNPFCAGSQVTFTATPNNGGPVPAYQWKVNGSNTGTNSPSFTYSPANGDQVSCLLNSSASCISGNPALSNIITMTVNTNLPAGVSISTPTNPFCPGTAVTFTANPTNGGGSPLYQWKLNGVNAGTNSTTFTCNPAVGDSIRCVITSNLNCVTGNPASSAKIIMSGNPVPDVSFSACFDTVTILSAQPFNLHGGLPLGGQYSGPGVNSITGTFTPSIAGTGLKTITYGYANVFTCLATKTKTILVQPNPAFTCGSNLTDIRDNKVYPTVQIGSHCWMAANLNYGTVLNSSQVQNDNCLSEKYCYSDITGNCTKYGGLYQWDEVMKYDDTPAGQGLCPPGWHVPTEIEWTTLFNFYLGNGLAGKPLQDTIMAGFRAQTSGVFYLNSSWSFNGFATLFWSSTSWNAVKAISHGMNVYDFSVSLYPSSRANAFPVRCLRD